MRLLAVVIVLYFSFASLLNLGLRGDIFFVSGGVLASANASIYTIRACIAIFAVLLIVAWRRSGSLGQFGGKVLRGAIAFAMCSVFIATFSSVKTSLPLIADQLGLAHFFADPVLARIDRALHFGRDPWEMAHAATNWAGLTDFGANASVLYVLWWVVPASYLPAVIALVGEDRQTLRHYVILWLFSWIVLGNLVAGGALSAGPIYFDRLFGGEAFAGLPAALEAGGHSGTWIAAIQNGLWGAYTEDAQAIGTGISAFPSVHVATMTVFLIYTIRKLPILAPAAAFLFASIFFISVWSGYHYAIDGYASVICVVALHLWLQRGRALDRKERSAEPVPTVDAAGSPVTMP